MGENHSHSRFLSVRQLAEAYPFKSERGWRWTIFMADENGFRSCLLRVGRRVIIDEEALVLWLRSAANYPAGEHRSA